jgi:hypothetical protein
MIRAVRPVRLRERQYDEYNWKFEVTKQRVIEELAKIGFANIEDLTEARRSADCGARQSDTGPAGCHDGDRALQAAIAPVKPASHISRAGEIGQIVDCGIGQWLSVLAAATTQARCCSRNDPTENKNLQSRIAGILRSTRRSRNIRSRSTLPAAHLGRRSNRSGGGSCSGAGQRPRFFASISAFQSWFHL